MRLRRRYTASARQDSRAHHAHGAALKRDFPLRPTRPADGCATCVAMPAAARVLVRAPSTRAPVQHAMPPSTTAWLLGAGMCGAVVGALVERCATGGAREREVWRAKLFQSMAVEAGRADGIEETMRCILVKAAAMIASERTSLFVVDKEHSELRSMMLLGGSSETQELRVPQSVGIAGHVSRTGETVNVANAYDSPHFCADYDKASGFRTQSVLCVPMFGACGDIAREVIAVVQLLNKPGGFTPQDEADLKELALLASVFLWRSSVADFMQWAGTERSQLMRTMSELESVGRRRGAPRQMTPTGTAEADRAARAFSDVHPTAAQLADLRSISDFDVLEFFGVPPAVPEGGAGTVPPTHPCDALLIPLLAVMFDDLGLSDAFGFTYDARINLALALRARYRNVPYHSFAHAFDVTHAMYGFLTRGGLRDVFTKHEQLALILAAMFHDSDHPGLNNQFHLRSKHPSSILLEATAGGSTEADSILEIHHCNVAIDVLTDLDFFGDTTLAAQEVSKIWHNVIACILATDMKDHNSFVEKARASTKGGEGDNGACSKILLMQLLMKTADISNVSKPFAQAVKWTGLVQEEFHTQGDAERRLGFDVQPMFDRKAQKAGGAVGFIRHLALPYFQAVAGVFPSLDYVVDQTKENVAVWEAMSP